MKNFSDIIGNRTRDLPTCNTVPQPTAPLRDPGVCSTVFVCKCIIPYIVVTMGVVSTPIPLVCSALWGSTLVIKPVIPLWRSLHSYSRFSRFFHYLFTYRPLLFYSLLTQLVSRGTFVQLHNLASEGLLYLFFFL